MRIFIVTKKMLIVGAVLLARILLAIILVCSMNEGNSSPNGVSAGLGEQYVLEVAAGKQKELPVYSVERNDKKIALTIDAAWEDDKTPFILAELERHNIKATFFLCGFWVEKYPEHVKAIHDAGHEIGNHSLTHPHMNKCSKEQIVDELKQFDNMLENITGARSVVFRAPYGEYNDSVILTVREQGYVPVQWNIDTIDWKEERSAQTILDSVIPKLNAGCIILCHNNGFKIETYLPTLLDTAIAQGYEFVTMSELLLKGDTIIDVNGVQKIA